MQQQSSLITKVENQPDDSDDEFSPHLLQQAQPVIQQQLVPVNTAQTEEKKKGDVEMGDEEVMITTTGNQKQLPNDDFDDENYYIPSTQSTPNVIGNVGDIQEE